MVSFSMSYFFHQGADEGVCRPRNVLSDPSASLRTGDLVRQSLEFAGVRRGRLTPPLLRDNFIDHRFIIWQDFGGYEAGD